MKFTATLLLTIITFINISSQEIDSLNIDASPKGGLNQLAIKYYGIDFSKEQRKTIENVEIEFIYSIDEFGNPTLSEINGVTDQTILDSLINKTAEIEKFNPQIRDGKPVPSIYFMKLTFPTYKFTQSTFGLLQGSAYREAKLNDFEYIKESGRRFDMVIGGLVNQFIGNPSNHLSLGGGMKIDLAYTTKNKQFYGLNMSFTQNGLKKDYPISSTREQISPVSGFVGLTIGRWFSKYSIQADINLAVQNITRRMGNNDPDWVQLNGWSPGLIFNYPILLGREKPLYYYGAPSLLGHNLNLSLGLRYVSFSLREASGVMVELGISYRMAIKGVQEYKLKDEFLLNLTPME